MSKGKNMHFGESAGFKSQLCYLFTYSVTHHFSLEFASMILLNHWVGQNIHSFFK